MILSVLAQRIGGKLEGPDGDSEVTGVSTLEDARPDQICYYGNRAYRTYLASTLALAVIVRERVETSSRNLIIVEHPYRAFRAALLLFPRETPSGFSGIHPSAVVHSGAEVGADVVIGPNCTVDDKAVICTGSRIGAGCHIGPGCRIGCDCLIHPGVSIYHDCRVGDRVIIHSGAVIGSDGFGFVPDPEGHLKVPQTGIVVLEDDVEIGACCTIDRAVVGRTLVGRFSKLDNLIHVAHNVTIGPGCLIAAQTGFAGSTSVGAGVTFGGQAGITGHIHIGDRAVIAAQAGVMKDVPQGVTVSGYPARSHQRSLRVNAALVELPEFRRRVMDFMKEHSKIEEEGQ